MQEQLLIRHGRSEHNTRETMFLDSKLTEFGEKQAITVGAFLAKNFDLSQWKIYTSPFLRCLLTTKLIVEGYNENSSNPIESKFINVNKLIGEWLEIENNEARKIIVKKREYMFDFDWDDYLETEFKTEANKDFLERMYKFTDYQKKKCIIISHATPILTMKKIITEKINNIPCWDFSVDNASISWISNKRLVWNSRNLHYEN